MNDLLDRPIGSEFEYKGEVVVVNKARKHNGCKDCELKGKNNCWNFLKCVASSRSDKNEVIAVKKPIHEFKQL